MKLIPFRIKRSDIDRLIHNLQHLKKMCDKQDNPRLVSVNLLEAKSDKKILGVFPQKHYRVVVSIDRMNQ